MRMRAPGRAAHAGLSCVALLLLVGGSLGASDTGGRYNALSHQMMCTCGCVQLLGECNHVGCPNSGPMLAALHTDLSSGMGDHAILADFAGKYGPESLASPLLTRFNQLAWVMPPLVLILGLLGGTLLLRRWRAREPLVSASSSVPVTAQQAAALERVRREMGEP